VAALALFYADDHSPTINGTHFELRDFGSPHSRPLKKHHESALQKVAGGINESAHFVQTENGW
jgi:hypothetical protein